MKKGVLFSFDMLLAFILFAGVIVIVISQDYSSDNADSLYLRSFSMDMMASLEKSGMFAQSISDVSELRRAINSLPPNICTRISIANSTNNTILEMQKEKCLHVGTFYTTYRTFYTNNELYLAKSQVWLK